MQGLERLACCLDDAKLTLRMLVVRQVVAARPLARCAGSGSSVHIEL